MVAQRLGAGGPAVLGESRIFLGLCQGRADPDDAFITQFTAPHSP